jgi:transcriptional regulator GlxA family with amidase domain
LHLSLNSQPEDDVSRRWFLLAGAAALAAPVVAAPLLLAPRQEIHALPEPAMIDPAEHARTIAAMRPPKRTRPAIAVIASNAATEVTDLLVPFNVLARSGVGDVFIVADRAEPVPLHPFSKFGQGAALFSVDPQLTMQAFDERWPDGADYVIVPAIEPRDDAAATSWIRAQREKGATIVSVCAGALTLGVAGLLNGRRATTHWAYIDDLRRANPNMQWVPDRRYVADDGVVTATGISASIPVSLALIEAIAGPLKARQVADELGVAHWDERHRSDRFQLTTERKKTFLRNWLSFWRHQTLGVPVNEGADETALAFTVDVWSRTSLSSLVTFGDQDTLQSLHGLTIRPTRRSGAVRVDELQASPLSTTPALTVDRELAEVASRFGAGTADIVALAMEYPWTTRAAAAGLAREGE